MKKVVYISDYTFNEYNSVRDILYNIVKNDALREYKHIIIKSNGSNLYPQKTVFTNEFKTYINEEKQISCILKSKDIKFFKKLSFLFRRALFFCLSRLHKENFYLSFLNKSFIREIIKSEKPDLVVFFIFSPNVEYVKLCCQLNIPVISILYDTYIERPYIDKIQAYKNEKAVIDKCVKYFIPNFFYNEYLKVYNCDKVQPYCLPLLIEKQDIVNAYSRNEKKEKKYPFIYFGQLQSFRNGNKVEEIFKKLNISLDIFSTEKHSSTSAFHFHDAITDEELYDSIAKSKFLVAIDNGVPYANYLPSKVYLYSSFSKPIIAFGNNDDSALKSFFKNYPNFYYQKFDEPLDNLKKFISTDFPDNFDENIYEKYKNYLPENATKPLISTIIETIESK